ncbi:MAG TPA: ABC transporter permease [Solirubrobacteraceae bacterium]|nr:ABC transporter permease [Solirubrobacteraceae bacterium]
MSRTRTVRLVAAREITERLRSRTTRLVTVITALLVVGAVTIPGLIKESSKPTRIGLVGPAARALAPTLERGARAAKVEISLTEAPGEAQGRAELRKGELDVLLSLAAPSKTAKVQVEQALSTTIGALISATVEQARLDAVLARAGVPLSKVLPVLAAAPIAVAVLKPAAPHEDARIVAAIAAALLMYLSLTLYGTAVATGVAQEKTSRTAEVLLASVRPGQLLAGKVAGIGLTGLGQLAIAAGAGLIANALSQSAKIPASVWALLPSFLAFFLVGFVLYAFVLAAAGALVSRQEEVQSVLLPVAMPLVLGYLLVFAAVGSPNATWLRVASLLPPLSATLMPARIALGHIAWWELPLDALLMLASILAVARIASRIYARALLHSGPRVGWRVALRLPGHAERGHSGASVT